jgi:hypothetical protein
MEVMFEFGDPVIEAGIHSAALASITRSLDHQIT